MSNAPVKYCLDANVLIQAWQKYYSPKFCKDYWSILNQLGTDKRIFIPQMVSEEISRTEDDLSKWLKESKIPVHAIDGRVSECLKRVYETDPSHQYIVANGSQHSLADPWVIAHAIQEQAVVVTKEIKDTYSNPTKIKIPHICDNMGIRWMNDFELVEELGIQFSCSLKS